MKFDDNKPIYKQIVHYIHGGIITKVFKQGDKLPSVRELAVQLEVNPTTIQRAYAELEEEGIIYTIRGTGKYLTKDKERIKELETGIAKQLTESFILEMMKLGISKEEIIEWVKKFKEVEKC
ncbi:GntR family transcriptional regulator [Listeria ivanovii]|uniref:Putative transcriptional regulator (GntR family) n=1 Tax=Listeria ivanovii (strain ATCC BAA-678 / PAM 55) TaxID=881621 RepID=G2ZD04_LISIP|nr:GntR family transcriptional regulator [Listeria ivanovii]AHI55259.1 GntR family transcriptional regulator [Listeria ivanovii WSLC3009]AIS64713.1 GntR family transcriptional regulator [Listeria ivanovii subsp. ivanovii]MBC1758591.1 GntR family transcriptional regulator [Listeria ivanovii]MBK3913465.1 GntR family transcriptional regulator [Listeria ivanovii subsp. ivanovii]MBK3920417.1 GntR family transcriptional regulator [Listeria ivanovii subsp. ivanovii]